MDHQGCGGWNSGKSSEEQDPTSNNNHNTCSSGGGGEGSGCGYYGDAFYRSGSSPPPDLYDGERRYYSTNNNDYSKYPGGNGEDAPPTTGCYDAYGTSSPGGYYTTHPCSPDYLDGQDPHSYASHNDYPQEKRTEHVGYSEYSSSQCYRDPSEQGYNPCHQAGYSDYSQHSRRHEYASSRVQVTAKVLFGSVSAISNLKQKKSTKKK
ncbi:uncharacterized protein [Panulirus ornatus]|uniref:uncharacterized protein n=1 Tax=Panulirus ornatus TaxID=150431 RepID=UPI003A873128